MECNKQKWVPEGSLFSPESFSHALCRARDFRRDILHRHHRETWVHEEDKKTGTSDHLVLPNTDLDAALLDMMRELQDLRSYFEGTLREDLSHNNDADQKPCVPALVVSTSHCTFPLALESFQDLAEHPSSSIAHRRGRSQAQPLKIGIENPSREVLNSEIPKIFLDSPIPDEQLIDSSSALRVEEMIDNLRLQCSTMSLNNPAIDSFWNSRSAIASLSNAADYEFTGTGKAKVCISPKTLATNSKDKGQQAASKSSQGVRAVRPLERRYRGQLNSSRTIYKPRATTLNATSARPLYCPKRVSSHPRPSIKQATLHPTLVKDHPPQRPLKCVRFVLPKSEVESDFSDCRNSLASHQVTGPIKPKTTSRVNPKPKLTKATVKPSLVAEISSQNTQVPNLRRPTSKQSTEQVKPTISPPVRKIALTRGSVEWKASNTLWRSNTLGRHSLSKIIKGPVLAFRENKRATISIETAFETKVDENAVRRQSDILSSPTIKKVRMPMQLKNIFSRFK